MSRVVVGYLEGHTVYRDDGPAVGRVQGHGGAALGYFSGTVVVKPPRVKLPRQALSVTRPRKDVPA